MSEIIENFDFMELGQAIQDAREKRTEKKEQNRIWEFIY